MLKWLRKYNTYILVVGGCLLMVAFLLQGVLSDLSHRGLFGSTAFKVGSKKVGAEEYHLASREYGVLARGLASITGRDVLAEIGGGENAEHWYLLTSEADKAGLVGGPQEGADYFDDILQRAARSAASQFVRDPMQLEAEVARAKPILAERFRQVGSDGGLSADQVNLALAKLRGSTRMQQAYSNAAVFSQRRLVSEARNSSDTITMDYILVPAERELAGVPEPTEAEIVAHFEKYKDIPRGGGDHGIGYKLPPRVKLTWMEITRDLISAAVTVDGIEVQKRFLAIYPNGDVTTPGKTPASERVRIEADVRRENTDKVLRAADQAVRAEIDKSTRKLEREGDLFKLPSDWASRRPDFTQIREQVAKRLSDQFKITIPAPKVVERSASWLDQNDAAALEGLSNASLRRGDQNRGFTQVLFGVHELADAAGGEPGFQVGVPYAETLESGMGGSGNRYYIMVLDARKESPPDAMDEVRQDIILNIKRLAAYEKLKAHEPSIRAEAVAGGLEAVARPPAASTDAALPVLETTISRARMSVSRNEKLQAIDSKQFREAVMASFASLDPLTDLTKIDNAAKTFSIPVDKLLSLCVYRAKRMLPVTMERFRTAQNALLMDAARNELAGATIEEYPFSFDAMRKRMNVTDSEGNELKNSRKDRASR